MPNSGGIFEMEKNGLKEVKNPSSIFLDPDRKSIAGVSIYVGSTGLRSVLFEIQSLITKSFLPVPRRVVVGFRAIALENIHLGLFLAKCL